MHLTRTAALLILALGAVGRSIANDSTITVAPEKDWAADIPGARYRQWIEADEIYVPMRDGVNLATDVILPKGAAGALPTILIRTPYDKTRYEGNAQPEWKEFWLRRGYAMVVQNERGRFLSQGRVTNYMEGAGTDGYDTVQWIVKQRWSNGKVGAFGCSSSADNQWPMAAGNPPGLASIIPIAATWSVGSIPGNATQGAFYRGGVPPGPGGGPFWSRFYPVERFEPPASSTQDERERLRNGVAFEERSPPDGDIEDLLRIPNEAATLGRPSSPWDSYITWTPGDPRWNQVEYLRGGAKPRVPAIDMDTWNDPTVIEHVRLFKYLQGMGIRNQYLVIGGGRHCQVIDEPYSELNYSALQRYVRDPLVRPALPMLTQKLARLKIDDLEIGDARYGGQDHGYARLFFDWSEHWLKGVQNRVLEMPKVQLFVAGKGWISGNEWPLKSTKFVAYYLNDHRQPRLGLDTGGLSDRRSNDETADSYRYDPAVPVIDFRALRDRRPIESRKDVLLYSTPHLQKPITIAGPIDVVLYVSSSVKDTDFFVTLVDEYPDGRALALSNDAFRVRYREGFDRKAWMERGKVYKIDLNDMVAATRFPKGHRIGLEISSSNFPGFERNFNTGGNNYDETEGIIAENSIHHGPRYPSMLVLPVQPE